MTPEIFAKKLKRARRQRDKARAQRDSLMREADAGEPVVAAALKLAAAGAFGWDDEQFRAAVHATIAAVVAYERGET